MSRAHALRRRGLVLAVLVVVLVAGYMLWLRNSSLFAVEQVEVSGVTANREEITAALEQAASEMTTLRVRDDQLREAVQGFPTVASISADSSLFHRLEITVTERPPVAEIAAGGGAQPVSADGYLLTGLESDAELPLIEAGSARGGRLDQEAAAQAAILGAAPGDLRDRLRASSWDESRGGVVVDLEGAPELRFGDGERAEEKWRALSALLADGAAAAVYIDVSVPERPVAA